MPSPPDPPSCVVRGAAPAEFRRIREYFAPIAGEGSLDLTDDAAILAPPVGRELVLTADAIVAGVHFLPDDPPDLVARKLLRVNLSDIAAMGAIPLGYLLTVSVPRDTTEAWFAAFAQGLARDHAEFGLQLLGGDTTSTPGPVSLSATMLGHVAPGAAWRRGGARPGDLLYVTGTIGDATLGLRAARNELADPTGHLASRYRLPQPRLALAGNPHVRACLDISDGLIQDSGHMARASGVGICLHAPLIPLSDAARATRAPIETVAAGGDDYELLLAIPADEATTFEATAPIPVTRIGECTEAPPYVTLLSATHTEIDITTAGYSHFP